MWHLGTQNDNCQERRGVEDIFAVPMKRALFAYLEDTHFFFFTHDSFWPMRFSIFGVRPCTTSLLRCPSIAG
jgi:hypothetical protein